MGVQKKMQKYIDRGWVLLQFKTSIPSIFCLLFLFCTEPQRWKESEDWIISSIALFPCIKNASPSLFFLFCFFLLCCLLNQKLVFLLPLFFLFSSFLYKTTFLFWTLFIPWSTFLLFQPLFPLLSSPESKWFQFHTQFFYFSLLSLFFGI
jgi:hypothetical protein